MVEVKTLSDRDEIKVYFGDSSTNAFNVVKVKDQWKHALQRTKWKFVLDLCDAVKKRHPKIEFNTPSTLQECLQYFDTHYKLFGGLGCHTNWQHVYDQCVLNFAKRFHGDESLTVMKSHLFVHLVEGYGEEK